MKKQSKQHSLPCGTTLIGTTTLRRMLSAVYDENDPLYSRNTYSECGRARLDCESNPDVGDEMVYIYYHRKENETVMTNIEGDTWGAGGSSAGFEGKVAIETLAQNK